MVFGVIKFGEGWRAKIKCKCTGMEKPKVSMTGNMIGKMQCAVAILEKVALDACPGDKAAQRDMIRSLAYTATEEVTNG